MMTVAGLYKSDTDQALYMYQSALCARYWMTALTHWVQNVHWVQIVHLVQSVHSVQNVHLVQNVHWVQ